MINNYSAKADYKEFEREMEQRVFAINASKAFPDHIKIALLIAINANSLIDAQYGFSTDPKILETLNRAKDKAQDLFKDSLNNVMRLVESEFKNE